MQAPSAAPTARVAIPVALVVLALVCCFPLGFVLIWLQSGWLREMKVKWTAIAGACVIGFYGFMAVLSLILGGVAAAQVERANDLWEQGDRATAVEVYKRYVGMIPSADQPNVYGRILDCEAERGNEDAVRQLWEEMKVPSGKTIHPNCQSEAAKAMLAKLWQQEAEREAETFTYEHDHEYSVVRLDVQPDDGLRRL